MKCPICGEEMLAGGLISAGISVGWVPKDEFDKKDLEEFPIRNGTVLVIPAFYEDRQRYQTLFYAKIAIKSLACLMFAKHFLIMKL